MILRDKNKNLEIHSQKGMKIFGDMDVLQWMELHKNFNDKKLMEKLIPREIFQYLPQKMIKDLNQF